MGADLKASVIEGKYRTWNIMKIHQAILALVINERQLLKRLRYKVICVRVWRHGAIRMPVVEAAGNRAHQRASFLIWKCCIWRKA